MTPHERRIDQTCLSYWWPKLVEAGVPTPETEIVHALPEQIEDVYRVFDGKELGAPARELARTIGQAAERIGYPVFLRTGHTSAKHDWERTCFVTCEDEILPHVIGIVEFSQLADFIGLPVMTWAVREFLPTQPIGVCPTYGNMPVCREFRVFAKDGELLCRHPYWPEKALEQGGYEPLMSQSPQTIKQAMEVLSHIRDGEEFDKIAKAAAEAVPGVWSIDLLDTKDGWYVTDMAEAHKSWHWPGCNVEVWINDAA